MSSQLQDRGCAIFQGSRSFPVGMQHLNAECLSGVLDGVSKDVPLLLDETLFGKNFSSQNYEPDRGIGLFDAKTTCRSGEGMLFGEDEVIPFGENHSSPSFVDFALICRVFSACFSRANNWSFVRTSCLFPIVLQCLILGAILAIAISSAACADELTMALQASFRRKSRIHSLYVWPHPDTGKLGRAFLRICCLGTLFLLELAEDDPAYDYAVGGVHILQGYFYCVTSMYIFMEACRFMRFREECHPKFPPRCRFRVGSRSGTKRNKTWTARKIVAFFLLINLSSAEAVGISSKARRANFSSLADDESGAASDVSQPKPEVDDNSYCSLSSVDSGLQDAGKFDPILFQDDPKFERAPLPQVPLCDTPASSCAPIGYHTFSSAVQEFCPHFVIGHDNLEPCQLSGDVTPNADNPHRCDRAIESKQSLLHTKDDRWTAIVWFAGYPVCQSEARQKQYPVRDFQLFQEDFNLLWGDRCANDCDFRLVQPQPPSSDFLLQQRVQHFLIWRRQLFSLRAVLIRSECGDEQFSLPSIAYDACGVSPANRERFCKSFDRLLGSQNSVQIHPSVADCLLKHGQFYRGARKSCLVKHAEEEAQSHATEWVSLMQVGPPVEDAIGRHIRLTVPNHRATRIMVWFHPVDARGRLSRLFKFEEYNHELPAGPQVRSFWASTVGRRQCFVYPVQPVPPSLPNSVPHFVLTTFQTSTIYPVLLDYISDQEQFRATFLFYFLGYPDVNGIFTQAIMANMCVWQTDCMVQLNSLAGMRTYEWGEIVPLYRGAYILLTEKDRQNSGSASTCSSAEERDEDESGSDGSYQHGHYYEVPGSNDEEAINLMQGVLYLRENTATLDRPDQWIYEEGVVASRFLLHYADSVADFIYQQSGRTWDDFRSVQSWVVVYTHELAYVPKFCRFTAGASLTQDLLDEWMELVDQEDIGFAAERYPTLVRRDDGVFNLVGAPLSQLRLGYRAYLITGPHDPIPSTIAVLCNGHETVYDIIQKIGFSERCRIRHCFLFQDRGGLNPIWELHDIVSETHGSHFALLADDWLRCEDEEGHVRHEHLSEFSHETSDVFSGMQLGWEIEMAGEEAELRRQLGLRPHDLASHVLWPMNGQICVDPASSMTEDPLKTYVDALRPLHQYPVHSVTTWMGRETVMLHPRVCAYVGKAHFTKAFLHEWSDFIEDGPYYVALVHPEVPPLSLKVSSLNLVGLTRTQYGMQARIFLLDILFRGLPRRMAVQCLTGDTLSSLVQRLGLQHLCGPGKYRCVLTQYEGDREWHLYDVIEEPHGASFKLVFREPVLRCAQGDNEANVDTDGVTLMQISDAPARLLARYAAQWFRTTGMMTFWIHPVDDHIVQIHSVICEFDNPNTAYSQCSELWDHGDTDAGFQLVPVEPAPVFISLPRPHVLVLRMTRDATLPVLCRARERGRHNLMSLIVPCQEQAVRVETLFQMAIPQHDCVHRNFCYALHEEVRYGFGHVLHLHRGAYVQIFEEERDETDGTCSLVTGDDEVRQSSLDSLSSRLDSEGYDETIGNLEEVLTPSSSTSGNFLSEETFYDDVLSFMQWSLHEGTGSSDLPTTLSTQRADSESLCNGYTPSGPIEHAPHFQNQVHQIEELRQWLVALIADQAAINLFVFEGGTTEVVTHEVVVPSSVVSAQESFMLWLRRELRSLWHGQSRIFPLQAAPFVDLRIAVLLPRAYGHELPVLLEIHYGYDTWREIHVVTQAVTINSLVWRSQLPNIVPETGHYQVMLAGEEAEPGDLIPWIPGQWLSIIVGQLALLGGEGTTNSFADSQVPSLSSLTTSHDASTSSGTRARDRPRQQSDAQQPEENDDASLFQTQVRGASNEWIRGPTGFLERFETLMQERGRFLEWRRKVDMTRRTTAFLHFDSFSTEAIAYWAALDRWPDFAIYSTKDSKIVHWGLAVDEFFVLEQFDFTTIVRDYVRSAIPFTVRAVILPVRPLPDVSEQRGEDDLFLLIDEDPEEHSIPVMISLWIRESDRMSELYAQRLPRTVMSASLLQSYGLEEVCEHWHYDCTVSYFGQELPRLVSWRPFPGMKIDIRVDILGSSHCGMEIDGSDEQSLMQSIVTTPGDTKNELWEHYDAKLDESRWNDWSADNDVPSFMQTDHTVLRRVRRASDLDPMLPLRSVHTWHGSFLLPNMVRDQVKIGLQMTLPGSWQSLKMLDCRCWGITSTTDLMTRAQIVLLRDQRWDEQFLQAALEMDIAPPMRLIIVASQPPESTFWHLLALHDDLFHSGHRFFLIRWPPHMTQSLAVFPCPELCQYDLVEERLGLTARCKESICLLRCRVPRGLSTYVSGQTVTMPTGTFCYFEFVQPDEVACQVLPPPAATMFVQRRVRVFRECTGNHGFSPDPMDGLPPPGNPDRLDTAAVVWSSRDVWKLDDWVFEDNLIRVVDFPALTLDISGQHQPRASDDKRILTLADKVIGCDIPMPDFAPLFHSLRCTWEKVQIRWHPIISRLSEEMQQLAAKLIIGEHEDPEWIEIFTDGSFNRDDKNKLAGWSIFVVSICGTETAIVDVDWGVVTTDPMDPTWTGAEVSNAKTAETTALIRAVEWLFAHPQASQCRLRFDSQLAGFSGSGDYSIRLKDRQLRLLRALVSAYEVSEVRAPKLHWDYVKGHAGHLGNEVADALAKQAFHLQADLRMQTRPDYTPYVFGHRYPIESFWLFFQQLSNGQRLLQQTTLTLPGVHIGGPASERLPDSLLRPVDDSQEHVQTKLSLFSATYNVLTLGEKAGGLFVQYLREQASAHCLDILFLQETRTRADQLIVSETHLRYTAAAQDGVGGVEIWLARSQAANGKPLFAQTQTQVLFASHQVMLLKTTYRGVELLLLTFHAPHSGCEKAVIFDFWEQLTKLVLPYHRKYANLLIGADANAHFDAELEGHIGGAGLEAATNYGGERFRRFLIELDLFLPSTYEHVHTGGHHTWWRSTVNKGARCDYFAVPRRWQEAYFETRVRTSLDEGKGAVDHLPLTMFCKIVFTVTRTPKQRRSFDRRALQRASKEALSKIFQNLVIPDWHVGVDQHAMQLTRQIEERICESFPKQRGPRRSYISEATWQIRAERLDLRRQTLKHKQRLDVLSMRFAFRCWNLGEAMGYKNLVLSGFSLVRQISQAQRRTAATSKELKKSLRADRTASLEQLATMEPQMSQRDFAQALQALGVRNAKKPCGLKPLPLLLNQNGETIDSQEELLACWRDYFGEQEDGVEVTMEALLAQSDARWGEPRAVPTWDFLPTLFQLEQQFRKCKPGKAFFLDGIPGEILHKVPSLMAKCFFSLMCKQVAFLREPVLFKGGFLTPAFKKGSPKLVQNYRSLFVSSTIGKALHSIYRHDLVRCFEHKGLQLQVGGIPGQGTTQPVHALRLHQLQAIRNGRSTAIVFVDISNAFYRLLRQHIVRVRGEDRSFQQLFEKLDLPEGSYEEFCSLLTQSSAIEEAEVRPCLQALFQEFFESTWFKLRDDNHIVQTRRGSRPGDSFADLCFSFALAKIVGRVIAAISVEYPELRIAWNGRYDPIPTGEQVHWLDPVMPIWADDIALAIDDESAEGLLAKCPYIVAQLFDSLQSAGLKPNLKPGKSEVLLDLRGQGALQCRRQMVFQDQQIHVPSRILPFSISAVGAYRHLGTWIQVGAGIARELKVKFAMAHDAITKYRPQIFSNKAMALERKRQFFHSLVLSIVGYNAAVWVPRNKRQEGQIASCFHRLYQRLAVQHFGASAMTWNRRWLLYKLGLPDATTVMTVSRLRYLGQLVFSGQPLIWGLLQRDKHWLECLQDDLAYLEFFCPEVGSFRPVQIHWQQLSEFIQSSAARWKRILRKLQARAVSMQKIDAEWLQWQQEIHDCLVEYEIVDPVVMSTEQSVFGCLCCRKMFRNKASLAVHAFKKHGRINRARAFVTGQQCECCLKHYELHSSLINHVKRGGACFVFYQQRGIRVQAEPAVNSRAEQKQKSCQRLPFMQAAGPKNSDFRPMPLPPENEVLRLQAAWSADLATQDAATTLLERLRVTTLTTFLYLEEIHEAFDVWTAQLDERVSLDKRATFAAFKQRATVEWFMSGSLMAETLRESIPDFFRREAGLMKRLHVPSPRSVSYVPKVFAHLFSGARRKGDFQEHVERLNAMAISVDIIFDIKWGNLLQPATFELFTRAMKEGVLCGFLSGPPCETWSRARSTQDSGPRVLRSRSRLQGLPSLTRREAEQVSIGNQLLGVTLRLFLFALITGAMAIVEHPACPDDRPDLPSIWWLDVIRCFLRFQACAKLRVFQGLYGGLSPKPTDLLFANCGSPDDIERFFVAARSTPMPKGERIGRETNGQWRTAVLKEYPAELCRTFARLFTTHGQSEGPEQKLPAWFEEAVRNLKADFDEAATMGPDCCRAALREVCT